MGSTAIYVSDTDSTDVAQYTKCSGDFHDGGFKNLENCQGQYLMIRRTGPGMYDIKYILCEVRVYSVANLLDGAVVIEASTPKHSDFNANNLVTNLETRSGR